MKSLFLQSTSRQCSSQSTLWPLSSGDHGNDCASVGGVRGVRGAGMLVLAHTRRLVCSLQSDAEA